MPSDLVIVYHRQPYEEVEEDGRTVFCENSSPNGIVPTLKSFFGAADHGAWIAWKLAEDTSNPDFEQVVEINQIGSGDHRARPQPFAAPDQPAQSEGREPMAAVMQDRLKELYASIQSRKKLSCASRIASSDTPSRLSPPTVPMRWKPTISASAMSGPSATMRLKASAFFGETVMT